MGERLLGALENFPGLARACSWGRMAVSGRIFRRRRFEYTVLHCGESELVDEQTQIPAAADIRYSTVLAANNAANLVRDDNSHLLRMAIRFYVSSRDDTLGSQTGSQNGPRGGESGG
jgi:hypothetical protein